MPGFPHHVTQRGTRKEDVYFSAVDYLKYLDLLDEWKHRVGVKIWAYSLMPNHVHLVLVPDEVESLSKFVGETHRRYARYINIQHDWSGHLWQERFYSSAMNEAYLLAAVRYVEQNPVRAGLVDCPQKWRWSSANSHLNKTSNKFLDPSPLLDMISDWQSYLEIQPEEKMLNKLRLSTRSGKPLLEI